MNERNDLTFKESKILNGMVIILVMTLIYSAVPEWQVERFIFNVAVATVLTIIIFYTWKKTAYKKRHFSILSYCFILHTAICTAQPIIVHFWSEESPVWVYLTVVWIAGFVITHSMKEGLFQAFSNAHENRFSIYFHLFLSICLYASPIFVMISGLREVDQAITFGSVSYLFSIIAQITLPAFLKHPRDIKEDSLSQT